MLVNQPRRLLRRGVDPGHLGLHQHFLADSVHSQLEIDDQALGHHQRDSRPFLGREAFVRSRHGVAAHRHARRSVASVGAGLQRSRGSGFELFHGHRGAAERSAGRVVHGPAQCCAHNLPMGRGGEHACQ